MRSPRTALTSGAERTVVTLINRYSAKGFPLRNEDIADAVYILVLLLPQSRPQKLPFVNNRPGKTFLCNFRKRHSDSIQFKRCSKEEEIRWKSCSAEVLTTHFAAVHKIIAENTIDCYHICNLDETGMFPNRECLKSSHKKGYVTRSCHPVKRSPEFRNIDRVIMMPVVFASSCVGRPLIGLEGKVSTFAL